MLVAVAVHVPTDGTIDPCCSAPDGHTSVSVTFSAASGPRLLTTTVYAPVSPGLTLLTPSALVTSRSADPAPGSATVVAAVRALLPGTLSVCPAPTVAVAVVDSTSPGVAAPPTVAVTVYVCPAPPASVAAAGSVHVTVCPTVVDAAHDVDTNVRRASSSTTSVAPSASLGPLFRTDTVYTTCCPTSTGSGTSASTVVSNSTTCASVFTSVSWLLLRFASGVGLATST